MYEAQLYAEDEPAKKEEKKEEPKKEEAKKEEPKKEDAKKEGDAKPAEKKEGDAKKDAPKKGATSLAFTSAVALAAISATLLWENIRQKNDIRASFQTSTRQQAIVASLFIKCDT